MFAGFEVLWIRYIGVVRRGSAKVFLQQLPRRLTASGQGGGGPLSVQELREIVVTSAGRSRIAIGSVCHTDSAKAAKDCWHAVRQVNQQAESCAGSVAPSSVPTTAGPSVSQAGQPGRSLNRVMLDMTTLGDSMPGSSSGVDRQPKVSADGFIGFLGIVRSLP